MFYIYTSASSASSVFQTIIEWYAPYDSTQSIIKVTHCLTRKSVLRDAFPVLFRYLCMTIFEKTMAEERLELNYEAFDRQVENLMAMSRVLATEVDDCGVQELTFDIMSLQAKSARLCYMADIDYALEQTEIAHARAEKDMEFHEQFEVLMGQYVSPMAMRILNEDINGNAVSLYKYPSLSTNMSSFLPRFKELVLADNEEGWLATLDSMSEKYDLFAKKMKITHFPGMNPAERIWRLFQFYLQMCYLMYHFRRVCKLCSQEVEPKEIGRLLTAAIQSYASSQDGSKELELYFAKLAYNNDGRQLTVDEMQTAQKALLREVPHSLQLSYINHVHDIDELGRAISQEHVSNEEIAALVSVMAKWQMLEQQIERVLHPQVEKDMLFNEVFHTEMNGKSISMSDLKERIARMLAEVTRKNHWMCVWCVLKHHNLLSTTMLEPFARQMMHKDWFGDISEEKRIKGDTLRDYTGYFTMYDYTRWNGAQFNAYCEMHNKKKWSPSLYNKFFLTCIRMDEAFEGE